MDEKKVDLIYIEDYPLTPVETTLIPSKNNSTYGCVVGMKENENPNIGCYLPISLIIAGIISILITLLLLSSYLPFLSPMLEKDIKKYGKNGLVKGNEKDIKNSILLLCSDGLTGYVKDNERIGIGRNNTPKKACKHNSYCCEF